MNIWLFTSRICDSSSVCSHCRSVCLFLRWFRFVFASFDRDVSKIRITCGPRSNDRRPPVTNDCMNRAYYRLIACHLYDSINKFHLIYFVIGFINVRHCARYTRGIFHSSDIANDISIAFVKQIRSFCFGHARQPGQIAQAVQCRRAGPGIWFSKTAQCPPQTQLPMFNIYSLLLPCSIVQARYLSISKLNICMAYTRKWLHTEFSEI